MSQTRKLLIKLIDDLTKDLMRVVLHRGQVCTGSLSTDFRYTPKKNPLNLDFYQDNDATYLKINPTTYILTSHGHEPLTLVRMKNALEAIDDLNAIKESLKSSSSEEKFDAQLIIAKLRDEIYHKRISTNEELTNQYGDGQFHRTYEQAKLTESSAFFAWMKTSWRKSHFNAAFEDGLNTIDKFCKIHKIPPPESGYMLLERTQTTFKPFSTSAS